MSFFLNEREVSSEAPPLIIAEIGINHGGSLEVAKLMAKAAANAGCEVVKHQTHIPDDEMTYHAKSIFPPNDKRSIWDVINESKLSLDEEVELKRYVESLGMIYLSTPFSRKAADFLDDIGIAAFKIGSGECNHYPLIEHIAKKGKPIILSTGMNSINQIKKSVDILRKYRIRGCLLECTNIYPSPPEYVSLQGISELKKKFSDFEVGFSDHSIGANVAISSVALGAVIIERHFTDSKYRNGPDISASMDPTELKYLIDNAKEIWLASRMPKGRSEPEEGVYKFARASVVASKNIQENELITTNNIWAKRPGNGEISVESYFDLIGKKVKRHLKADEQIKWDDIY